MELVVLRQKMTPGERALGRDGSRTIPTKAGWVQYQTFLMIHMLSALISKARLLSLQEPDPQTLLRAILKNLT